MDTLETWFPFNITEIYNLVIAPFWPIAVFPAPNSQVTCKEHHQTDHPPMTGEMCTEDSLKLVYQKILSDFQLLANWPMTTSDGHSRNSPSLARHKNLGPTDQWSTKQGWSAVVSGGIPPAPLTNGWTSFWPLVAVSPHHHHDYGHPPTLGVPLSLVRDLNVKNIPQFVALRIMSHTN